MRRVFPIAFVTLLILGIFSTIAFSQGMGGSGQAMGNVPGLSQYPLTSEQRQQIAQIRSQTQAQARTIRMDRNLTQAERNRRLTELHASQHSKVMDVLTPPQRQEFSNWWQERQAGVGAGPGMRPGMGMMGTMPGLRDNPLTAEQRQQIIRIRQQTQAQIRDIRANRTMTSADKNVRIGEIQAQQNRQIMDLLTPAQREEFNDWWQSRQSSQPGTGVGAGPGMGRKMGMKGDIPGLSQNPLSEAQREQISQIRMEAQQQVTAIMNDANLTSQQKQDRIAAIHSETHDRVVGVMTPAQREEFQEWWKNHPSGGQGMRTS